MTKKIFGKCAICGKETQTWPCRLIKGEGKFCSRECKGLAKRNKVSKSCLACGKPFSHVPSKPQKFCSHSCHASSQIAEKHSVFRGEVAIEKGYKFVYLPTHPQAKNSRIKLCRLVVEKILGKVLGPDDVIHHINGNKLDDRPENLYLCTRAEHVVIHRKKLAVVSNIV